MEGEYSFIEATKFVEQGHEMINKYNNKEALVIREDTILVVTASDSPAKAISPRAINVTDLNKVWIKKYPEAFSAARLKKLQKDAFDQGYTIALMQIKNEFAEITSRRKNKLFDPKTSLNPYL